MNADILLLVAAALFTGAMLGVLAVGLVQLWHDRRMPQLGRKDGAR